MGINLTNFLSSKSKNRKMNEFQDLDHLDGLAISTVSANLYQNTRDDLVMFYFREGANYASLYTQSKIVSENIKWNLNQKSKRIYSLLISVATGSYTYKFPCVSTRNLGADSDGFSLANSMPIRLYQS